MSREQVPLVNQNPDRDGVHNQAAGELARLEEQVRGMRSVLVRLLLEVVVAEGLLVNGQGSLLLQANEALVVAALRDQADAETATQALDDVSRTVGLDPLTQLPNRLLFNDRLARGFGCARCRKEREAVR